MNIAPVIEVADSSTVRRERRRPYSVAG